MSKHMSTGDRYIGGLKVVRLLGKGGMSEVYECENPRLGSRHAVKLYCYSREDAEIRTRFETEGKLLAKLNHPRIVRVSDLGIDEASGNPYFVMDLVLDEHGETRSLGDVGDGEADEEMIGRWYDDIREGLAYIHGMGVIHRDLKLQNVLIGPDGHAVLTDFGVSKIFTAEGAEKPVVDTVRTLVKMREGRTLVMGSLGYMAPELEMGVAASPQSDWYALGVIVYKLLTGMWCDSRTDVAATLDTYDPVWSRILPKLLHANPLGRECLCWADEMRVEREQAECRSEERWILAKSRGHVARHVARYLAVALTAVSVAFVWKAVRDRSQLERYEEQLSLPGFSDLFEIPEEAGEDESESMPSREQFRSALVDALVLTQDDFADLHAGEISVAKFRTKLNSLARRARADDDLFAGFPDSYTSSEEGAALSMLFRNAAKRLAE